MEVPQYYSLQTEQTWQKGSQACSCTSIIAQLLIKGQKRTLADQIHLKQNIVGLQQLLAVVTSLDIFPFILLPVSLLLYQNCERFLICFRRGYLAYST